MRPSEIANFSGRERSVRLIAVRARLASPITKMLIWPPQGAMVNPTRTLPLRWRFKYVSESNSSVPTSPGVYVIGHCQCHHGLELKRVYVYVGESANLQRRLDEHLPDTEQNPRLRAYLREHYAAATCWYLPTDASQRRGVQDDLIREIQPEFNTLGL